MCYPCLIAGLGMLPPITGLSTLPIFTNSGGPSAMLPSQSTALAMGNVEVANQSATTDQWSLPPKLTKKILELEYIEMSELLPESWRLQQEGEQCCNHHLPQSGERYPNVAGMLCCNGGCALNKIFAQDATSYGLPANNSKGPPVICG